MLFPQFLEAFGFKPAHSAADGAAVTQLKLELGWLKGCLVSCVGLDYRKCFDLMPQGIVFEVCTRLGIWPCMANWSMPLSGRGTWGHGRKPPTAENGGPRFVGLPEMGSGTR